MNTGEIAGRLEIDRPTAEPPVSVLLSPTSDRRVHDPSRRWRRRRWVDAPCAASEPRVSPLSPTVTIHRRRRRDGA
jgi:hypothetical protein